jgi:hypothetical protein
MTIDVSKFPFNGFELVGSWHLVFADEGMTGTFAFGTKVEKGRTVEPVLSRVARHFCAALGHGVRVAYALDANPEGMPLVLGEMPDEELVELYRDALDRWFDATPEDHPIRELAKTGNDTREALKEVVPEAVFEAVCRVNEVAARLSAKRGADVAEQDAAMEAERKRAEAEEAAKAEAEAAANAEAAAAAAAEAARAEAELKATADAAASAETQPPPALELSEDDVAALDVDFAYSLAEELGVEVPATGERRSKKRALDALVASGKVVILGEKTGT